MVGVYPGGIFELASLAGEHTAELAADMRAIYGVGLWDVSGRELWHLVRALLSDPRSRLHAKVAGWEYPVSREWLLLADLYDMQLASKAARKTMPYSRPFGSARPKKRGASRGRSMTEVMAILRPEHERGQT